MSTSHIRSDRYPTVSPLGPGDFDKIQSLLFSDIPSHLFMLAWLENYGVHTPGRALFKWLGVFEKNLVAVALLINDKLLMLSLSSDENIRLLASHLEHSQITLEHIVAPSEEVLAFWDVYAAKVPSARLIREQTYLELKKQYFVEKGSDCPLRLASIDELDAVFLASVAMHVEETLDNPLDSEGSQFRRHIEHRILSHRTYVWFNEIGQLIFKADLSAHCSLGAQISGIYVPKPMRNLGFGTRGISALCDILFQRGFPLLTLYVNNDNRNARKVYHNLGFKEHIDFHTIFVT